MNGRVPKSTTTPSIGCARTSRAPRSRWHGQRMPNLPSRRWVNLPQSTPGTNNGNSWAIDACKYCYYRPLAPAHIPPGHADHWWYGTGRGDHNPRRCQACKRFLAEGGDRQRQPRYADHMAQCVKADKRLRTAG